MDNIIYILINETIPGYVKIGILILRQVLVVIDDYLKLILTSWPAVILILSIFILLRYKEAINNRIQNIKSVGRGGVTMYPPSPELVTIPESERELSGSENYTIGHEIALVEYKIASSLPGTIVFNFLRDWKVWFWIANREPKKYKAYVKIKFITERYEEEVGEGYYGGTKAWNLNAFSGIQAPGLGIPDKIKEVANQRKNIKIEINCTVKDENEKLVEKKLPNIYAYEYKGEYWYLEP
jgi:hypothetical protein